MLRFGICTHPSNAQLLSDLGYDYLECSVAQLASMSEEEYERVKLSVLRSPIRAEAANSFLPGDYTLCGPAADPIAAIAYVRTAVARAAALGVQVVVFGSAGARAVPEGWAQADAMEQLADFCRMAGDICAPYGIRIAIEPLNRKESNIINSVAEGFALANMANHPNVGVLADWYHMGMESEGTKGMMLAGKQLWHCHIANLSGRTFPKDADPKEADYQSFFDALRKIGYDGRVSIEGKGDPATEGAEGLRVLQGYR